MISKDILRDSRLLIVCTLLIAVFVKDTDAIQTRRTSQEDGSPSHVGLANWRLPHTQHMQSNPQQLSGIFNKVPPGRGSHEAIQSSSLGAKQPFTDNVQPVPHRYGHDQSNTDNRRNPTKNTLRIHPFYGNRDPKRGSQPRDDLQAKMSLVAPPSSNSESFKLPVVYKEVNEVPYGPSVVEQAPGQGQGAPGVYSFSQVVKIAQSNKKPAFIRVKSNLLDKQQFDFARLETVQKASDAQTDVFFGLGNPVQVHGKYGSAGVQSTFTDPVRKPTARETERRPSSTGHNEMQAVPPLPSADENSSKDKRSPRLFGFDKSVDYKIKTDLDYPSVFKKYGFSQKRRVPSTVPPTARETEIALTPKSKSDDTAAGKSDPFQGNFKLHSYGPHKSANIQLVPLLNGFQLKGQSDGTSVPGNGLNQGGKLSPGTMPIKNEGTVYRFDPLTYRKTKGKSSYSPSELSFSTTAGPKESSAGLIPKIHRSAGFLDLQFGSIQSNTDTLTSPQEAARMPRVRSSENSEARQKSEDSVVSSPHRFAPNQHKTGQKVYAPVGFKTLLKRNPPMGPKTSELLYKSVSSDLPRSHGRPTHARSFNCFNTDSAMSAGNPKPMEGVQRLPVTYEHDENLKPSAAVVKGKRVKKYFKSKNWRTRHGHAADEQFSPLRFTGVKFTDVMGSASFSGVSPADQMWSGSPDNHNNGAESLSKPKKTVTHAHSAQFSGDWYGLQSAAGGIKNGHGVFSSMLTANSKSSSYRQRQEGPVLNMSASLESLSLDHNNALSTKGRSTGSEHVNFDIPEDLLELDDLKKLTRYNSFNSIQQRLSS